MQAFKPSTDKRGMMMTMQRWKGFTVVAALMLALVASPVAAEEVPLEPAQVERYLDSMRVLQGFARDYEERDEDLTLEQERALYLEQRSILDEYGFGEGEWVSKQQRIMQAITAIHMQRQRGENDMGAGLKAQREQILANENLTEEQREAMLEQIEQQRQMVAEIQDNPDVDAVEPYYDELREVFEGGL